MSLRFHAVEENMLFSRALFLYKALFNSKGRNKTEVQIGSQIIGQSDCCDMRAMGGVKDDRNFKFQ